MENYSYTYEPSNRKRQEKLKCCRNGSKSVFVVQTEINILVKLAGQIKADFVNDAHWYFELEYFRIVWSWSL